MPSNQISNFASLGRQLRRRIYQPRFGYVSVKKLSFRSKLKSVLIIRTLIDVDTQFGVTFFLTPPPFLHFIMENVINNEIEVFPSQ